MTVKKVLKSKSELKKMALSKGARITDASGNIFNDKRKKTAAGEKIPEPEKKELPAPAPKPVIAGPDAGSKLVAEKIETSGHDTVVMLENLRKQIADIQMNAAQPPMEWVFDFERNEQGYLTRIVATADSKKTLN